MVVIIALILQREKKEWEIIIIIGSSVLFFFLCISRIETVVRFLTEIWSNLPVDKSLLTPIFKMLGIAYAAEFASSICQDAGHPSIGNQVELFAKLSIVVLSLPGLSYLLQILEGIF